MIKVNGKIVEKKLFPDGTFSTKLSSEFADKEKTIITWLYSEDSEFVLLMFITKHLKNMGVKNIELYMPYIPNARLDRVKSEEDIFTLKYFAQAINDLGFDQVRVLDPHSYVSEALIERIKIDVPNAMIEKVLNKIATENNVDEKEITMFYPDEGAMKRYCGNFNNPFAFGIKKRDWKSGDILGLEVSGETDRIKGKNILIIDDICSKGGTFYHSAKKLKELGAGNIYLYISHCENTILKGDVLTSGLVERVYTTNSIFNETNEKITVFEL